MTAGSPPQKQQGSSSQILMMMMLFATMFIMFDTDMRNGIGGIAGIILEPIIGFDKNFPLMTVMLAGLGLVTFSSIVRDYFIDWTESAEKQARMKDFNKVLKEARMAGNEARTKRLQEQQMEMSKDQMASTMDQMKPMMFTMIFLVATFAFIGSFIESIPGAVFSVPWKANVDMVAHAVSGNQCCAFTNWMLLYMLVSMSFSQIISRILKWYKFTRMLENPEKYAKKEEPEEEEEDGWEDEDLEGDEDDEYLEIADSDESVTESDDSANGEEEDEEPDDEEEYDDDDLEVDDDVLDSADPEEPDHDLEIIMENYAVETVETGVEKVDKTTGKMPDKATEEMAYKPVKIED